MAAFLTFRCRSIARTARRPAQMIPAQTNRDAIAQALGSPVLPKLKLGAPNDTQEQEADGMADRVMRMPAPGASVTAAGESIQRKCAACDEEEALRRKSTEEDEKQRKPPPAASQEKPEEKEEDVQRKGEGEAGGAVAAATAARIQARRGEGIPLPPTERAFFEPRFGTGLGHVRLHADPDSARLSAGLAARAFTVGPDVFFGTGEYRPGTASGRHLLAHELTHVLQQRRQAAGVLRRWNIGAAPAPGGFAVLTDAEHLRRVGQAEAIVRGLLASRNCRNYFTDHCTDGSGAAALRDAFDNAQVYLLPHDDDTFGSSINGTHDIAVNLRRIRIGRFAIAHTLLHEMFHTCDPVLDPNDEIDAENANEVCRLYAPWIVGRTPRSGAVGSRVTITGIGFGGGQGPADSVQIGGVDAPVISWAFTGAADSSAVEIVAEVPAGAGAGGIVVINNGVRSNAAAFSVT